MFEKASKQKLRFPSSVGESSVTVEDLWDLPLTHSTKINLNDIAKRISKTIKDLDGEDFVGTSSDNEIIKTLELKLEIVKHIIAVKKDEKAIEDNKKATKANNDLILSIIGNKQMEELQGKSIDELKALLNPQAKA